MELIVVGAGWAGERHVHACRRLEHQGEDVRLAALVDVDEAFLNEKAREWCVQRTYSSLEDALDAESDADGVVLATPHNLHRQGTELAAAAGRHMLVEKPMALTLEDADAMIAACDHAGTTLMVAESARYGEANRAIHRVLEDGRIGRVLSGRMCRVGTGHHTYVYPGRRSWLAQPDKGGSGIWMLNGVHAMSTARMLLGEVERIYAREVHSPLFESDLEATVVALIDFDGGATLTMTVSAELHGYKRFGDLVLFGERGTLSLNPRGDSGLTVLTDEGEEVIDCTEPDEGGVPGRFVRQMREFVRAVRADRPAYTSGHEERATLAAILAGYRSIHTGEPVVPER